MSSTAPAGEGGSNEQFLNFCDRKFLDLAQSLELGFVIGAMAPLPCAGDVITEWWIYFFGSRTKRRATSAEYVLWHELLALDSACTVLTRKLAELSKRIEDRE